MYEVGDRIRITYVLNDIDPYKVGDCGTIIEVNREAYTACPYLVKFDNGIKDWLFYYDEFELIENEDVGNIKNRSN